MANYYKKSFLIISLDRNPGGITTMVRNSSKALSDLGYIVKILIPKNSYSYYFLKNNFRDLKSIEIIPYTAIARLLLKLRIFFSGKIKSLVLSADIVFLHNVNLIMSIKLIDPNKKVFVFNHTDKIKDINKFLLADKILSVNTSFTKILNSFNSKANKAVTLPNSIYLNPKSFIKKKSGEKFVVGCIGRMVDKKGFDIIIEACSSSQDIQLILAGDGPLKKRLFSLAREKKIDIRFIGWVENLNDFFNKLDVFCLPSRLEPFGLVLIEAMAREIPVISTNCNGPKDIIKNNYNGIIIQENSASAIYQAVDYLKGNKVYRNKISKAGLNTIKKNYTLDVYTNNFRIILENYYKSTGLQ